MANDKFKFVSPGIFIDEIDNSQRPGAAIEIGPVVIGRARRGPAMRPITVESFSEFVEIFGNPVPGTEGGDVWRKGTGLTGPTYAAYAAQAWLRNNTPLTFVRLLGVSAEGSSKGSGGPAGSSGASGWKLAADGGVSTPGGAYGLFLFNEGGRYESNAANPYTASLGAVFYVNSGVGIAPSGNIMNAAHAVPTSGSLTASCALPIATGSDGNFTMMVFDDGATDHAGDKIKFNFNENSPHYIRKVFNTNPTNVNSNVTSTSANSYKTYWLGETYDRFVFSHDQFSGSQTGNDGKSVGVSQNTHSPASGSGMTSNSDITHCVMLRLGSSDGNVNWHDHLSTAQQLLDAETGWFIGQDLGANTSYHPEKQQKLFKLVGLNYGEWLQDNLKVSIRDIKPSSNKVDPYGTFTLLIRKLEDSDNAPKIVESFSDCNLNPNSLNYVGRKVGNEFVLWDSDERRYRRHGEYPNRSKFVRLKMNADVHEGKTDPSLLPFGVFGPLRINVMTGVTGSKDGKGHEGNGDAAYWMARGSGSVYPDADQNLGAVDASLGHTVSRSAGPAGHPFLHVNFTSSFHFPEVPLRVSASDGNLSNPRDAYFGATTTKRGSTAFDPSIRDIVRRLPGQYSTTGLDGTNYDEVSWVFSLDNLMDVDPGTASGGVEVVYASGSRLRTNSITARSGAAYLLTGSTYGYNQFSTVFHGGFDGLDIMEREPFRNTRLDDSTVETLNSAFHSVKRAIDTIRDPEAVEFNLAALPGVTNSSLTDHLIKTCEDRGDALAIIDLENDFVPDTENTATIENRRPNVAKAVNSLRDRQLNSSYGAAYFPFVQIRDSISNQLVYAPPSVVALGVMSNSEAKRALWFAPAGFTRGGISTGAAGLPVVNVTTQLTSKDRDSLYEANVNPIASFPAEGLVVFGQKTLQLTPSALDRINVRRLLIFIKKEISRMAATTLFEQNVQATWTQFKNKAVTFLTNIKAAQGLTDFRVVLDETTTTPELIDRNIMYAKVFLKPARAIEFIALDFVITDTGASFDD